MSYVVSKLSPSELWTLKSHDNRVNTAICARMESPKIRSFFPPPQTGSISSSLGPGHALLFDLLPGVELVGRAQPPNFDIYI